MSKPRNETLEQLLRDVDWSDPRVREYAVSKLTAIAIDFDRLYRLSTPRERTELRGIIELMVQDVAEAEPRTKLTAVR